MAREIRTTLNPEQAWERLKQEFDRGFWKRDANVRGSIFADFGDDVCDMGIQNKWDKFNEGWQPRYRVGIRGEEDGSVVQLKFRLRWYNLVTAPFFLFFAVFVASSTAMVEISDTIEIPFVVIMVLLGIWTVLDFRSEFRRLVDFLEDVYGVHQESIDEL